MSKLTIGSPLRFNIWYRRMTTAWLHATFVLLFLAVGTAVRFAYIVLLTSPPIISELYQEKSISSFQPISSGTLRCTNKV